MSYSVQTQVSIRAAAKLFISGEMDLYQNYPLQITEKILLEILDLSIDEILNIVDNNLYGTVADMKYIPQCGKLENVIKVPHYFMDNGTACADYSQIGFYLKQDIKSSLVANVKFGETHGKAASFLGIVECENKKICPSSFTYAFCSLDTDQQNELLVKLLFRIPIVQIILKHSRVNPFNGHIPMQTLQASTMHRRSQCLRMIFNALNEYDNSNLKTRINNITWEEIGDESC